MVNLKYKKIIILIPVILLIIFSIFAFFKFNQTKIHPFPKITPNSDNSINIVFTTDKEYSPYLKVALKSLILNKDKDSIYNIYILCIDLNKKIKQELKQFEQDKVKINTVALKKSMLKKEGKFKTNLHYVSDVDYFKFFLSEIFKDFDKILYLDSDILVLGDLSSLYNTDIQDKYIAAVRSIDFKKDIYNKRYNIGVMLCNLSLWRKEGLTKMLIDIKNNSKNDATVTQNTFNALPDDKIKSISPTYNNRIKMTQDNFEEYNYKKNYYPYLENINNIDELNKKTIIIHFAGFKKPWFNDKIKFAKIWWQYAHLVNPYWKVEKRSFIDIISDALIISIKLTGKNNLKQYIEKFYSTFKTLKGEI